MSASPTKRTRTTSNAGASAGENRSKAQIIVVSSTPTRRGAARTPRTRTPRTPRTAETPRTSPKKPRKVERGVTTSPLKTPSKSTAGNNASYRSATSEANSSEEDTDSNEDDDDAGDNDDLPIETSGSNNQYQTTLKPPELVDGATIQRTTSDVYFHLHSKPALTSSNVFSSLLPQLSPEECVALTRSSSSHIKKKHPKFLAALREKNEANYARWEFELGQGFNLLLYGYGSKLHIINDFARRRCSRNGHVVIVNGFWSPAVSMRDVLDAICDPLPDIARDTEASSSLGGIERQTQRIYRYFALPTHPTPAKRIRPLFLIIHSIDHSTQLRTPRARACLSLLASNPHIHVIASIDNIHSGMMWTSGEMLGRSHASTVDIRDQSIESSNTDADADARRNDQPANPVPSSRGFAWLWHEIITFEPYDVELSCRDVSVLPRTRGNAMGDLESGVVVPGTEGAPINETAAKQVLASVTQKARRLFELLGRAQLAALEESGNVPSATGSSSLGMAYDILALRAREEFLAASDGALRALLTEFRDHGLVAQTSGATYEGGSGKIAGDVLWIPLSRDVLARMLDGLSE